MKFEKPTAEQLSEIVMYIKSNIKFFTEEEQLKHIKEAVNQATTVKETKFKPETFNIVELLEGIENTIGIMLNSSQIKKIISLIQL